MTRPVADRAERGAAARRVAAYAFLTPNLLLLGLFVFVPLVGAVVISLQQHQRLRRRAPSSGCDNYARLRRRPAVLARRRSTRVLFTVLVTPLSMALGLGAAVLLNSVLPARGAVPVDR